jgi:hypothetical protein
VERHHRHDVKIDNGDDCITIKSGSSNVLVERVECHHSHGITVGSIWFVHQRNRPTLAGFVWVCLGLLGFVWVCLGLFGFVWVCLGLLGFV